MDKNLQAFARNKTPIVKKQSRGNGTLYGKHSDGPGNSRTGLVVRKRPPLERMEWIYRWLREGKFPTAGSLAADLEVSVKTAKRDIEFMRERMNFPIEYDGSRHGYHLAKPDSSFPGLQLNHTDLFALFIAMKFLDLFKGTSLEQPLELAFQKLTGRLDEQERGMLHTMDEALTFRPLAPGNSDLGIFELVTRAVAESRVITFEYRKPGERMFEDRHVHPYHVMVFEHRWYLLAYDLQRGDLRNFALARMRNPVSTGERFDRPANFRPEQYLGGSLGIMTGRGDFEVIVEMDAWLTDVQRGRRWHASQVWMELPNGGSRLRLRLSSLEEIEQCVLSWGMHARVIRPVALAQRIRAVATRLMSVYHETPNQPT